MKMLEFPTISLKRILKILCQEVKNSDILMRIILTLTDQNIRKAADRAKYYKNLKGLTIKKKKFLIWISRSFQKGASDNTISYFD